MKKFVSVCLLGLFVCGSVFSDTHYVDRNSPNPVAPYLSWETAATEIQQAVDSASSGDTVLVTNGVYDTGGAGTPWHSCDNRVVITKDITLQSVNGADVTFIQGSEATGGGRGADAVRGVYMSSGLLSGFTITNGHTQTSGDYDYDQHGGGVNLYFGRGAVNDCTLTGNSAFHGGGSYRGTLNNCTLTGNSARSTGGGSYKGTLNNCTLTGNSAGDGGGSSGGTLNNCTLTWNSANDDGGGSYYGTLNNCTLTWNSAYYDGGGSYYGTLNNCIVYHNTAGSGENWISGAFLNSCTFPLPSGTGNITNDPMLVSYSHISSNSPCVGAGSATFALGTDIDGDAWQSPPSMGCDEPLSPFAGELQVSISVSETNVVAGHSLSFFANIVGEVASNRWDFGDGISRLNEVFLHHAWSTPGLFEVVLTAYNDDFPSGVSVTQEMTVFSVEDTTIYVSSSTGDDGQDGKSWATAKKTLQAGVDCAEYAGATVWATNGIYDAGGSVTPGYTSVNRVVITNDITLRSVNGADMTFIQGAESTGGGNGSGAVRGVYMSAGRLSGFTVTNGHTQTSGDSDFDQNGGGVNLYFGDGAVNNCTLTGNSANYKGGGSYRGTLNNCTLTGNSANYGGGNSCGTLKNCTLTGNSAYYSGGGSHSGTLNNCTLTGNSASNGGGSYHGTLNNCTLTGNSASNRGGGNYYGTLNNCTLTGNSASNGGGSYYGTLNNCIVFYNTDDDNWEYGTFSYSCTVPDPGGTGNITNSPLFVDRSNGNLQLMPGFPCVNSGDNGSAPSGTDLAGNPRVVDGTVDMGAYEFVFDYLMLSPNEGLVSSGYESGPFSPSSKGYVLSNIGVSNLSWSASWGESWIDVSPASGLLSVGGSANVTVSFTSDAESLPPGTYSDEIVFSNQASGATQSLAVVLDIALPTIASESFESGIGSWADSSGYDFSWTRHSGSTTSSGTGPSGTEDGTYYIYTESSSPNYPSKTAAVEATFDFSAISAPTLSFDYHMYGATMGTLNVDVFDGTWHTGVWSLAGQQQAGNGDAWEQATVNLASYGNKSVVKIRFRGVTGGGYTSDMALDNVVLRGVQTTTDPDIDGDGLPDWWEEQYFSDATNATPDTLCANGINTVREAYIAGLDPTNATSRLILNPVSGNALHWSAISGRVYSIWWTTNLLENFQPLETNLFWPQGGYTNPNPSPSDFYKIKVELE